MPRILFTFAGGTGHFLPLVPFARAADDAGHEVAAGGQQALLPLIERMGFEAFDTGGASLRDRGDRDALAPASFEEEARRIRAGFGGHRARERAANVLALCESWRPDVLVCDEMDFGAVVAAEALALPFATVVCIGSGSFVWSEIVGEPLGALRGEYGLPSDPALEMLHRHLTLTPFPPRFRDPANPLPANAHAIRATVRETSGHADDAAWLAARAARPLVYFTLGTVFNQESGDLFERVLAGLSELDADVVVTVGRELDPDALGPQPENVRVRTYVPQSILLPHCDLAVSHGGSGSVLGALTHGVPMLLLPIAADQPSNAARCAELGVAQVLDPLGARPADLLRAATEALSEPSYRERAGGFADEISALPGPERAVELLEELVARR